MDAFRSISSEQLEAILKDTPKAANEENLRIFVATYRELGQDEESIRKILEEKFGLDEVAILRML